VKPQKKSAPGVTNEPFAAASDDEGDEDMEGDEDDVDEEGEDGEEEIEETRAAPPSSPKRRSKNASNVPFPSRNKEEVNKEIKKLSWFKRTLLLHGSGYSQGATQHLYSEQEYHSQPRLDCRPSSSAPQPSSS
jgi:hypothetical protein